MNRRSFFRLGAGIVGAAAVAPKVLAGTLPVVAEPVFELVPVEVATTLTFAPSAYAFAGEYSFYSSLTKLCIQFFGQHSFYITEDYGQGNVNIEAPTLDDEDLFFFKKSLFYMRPPGVLVNLNGQSALLPYDFEMQ